MVRMLRMLRLVDCCDVDEGVCDPIGVEECVGSGVGTREISLPPAEEDGSVGCEMAFCPVMTVPSSKPAEM